MPEELTTMDDFPIRMTLREQLVDRIRNDVLSGRLAGGEPLREQHLAAKFRISRGPVRDALLELTKEGLLIARPNCGVRVGNPPDESVRSLIVQLRREIESFALRSAFDRIDESVLKRMRANLQAFRTACQSQDLSRVVQYDMAFHRMILELVEEEDLSNIWLPVVSRMVLPYSRHHNVMDSYCEHEAIVDAISQGDCDLAVQRLVANIQ
ncbi:MAG: GntR family transcriptional regulator [Phycisphaeraceae bacterium]|nr:GntR family transcriptional regulator [Phycisphaeraceae bacterium]